jgi:hypothetical protein
VRAVPRGCEHASHRAGDRTHRAPARRELASRCGQALEQLRRRRGRHLGDVGERLHGTTGHPAPTVPAVVPQLFEPLGEAPHPRGVYEPG